MHGRPGAVARVCWRNMRTRPSGPDATALGDAVRIRRAVPGDAAALAWIRTASWRAAYAEILGPRTLERTSRGDADRMRRAVNGQTEGRRVWVAEQRGIALGYAWSGPQVDRRVVADGRAFLGEIHELYLHPQWQRQGVGSRLLVHAIWRLVDAGLHPPMLWVLGPNSARRFYESNGGVEFARRPLQVGGRMLEEIAYGWHDQLPLP